MHQEWYKIRDVIGAPSEFQATRRLIESLTPEWRLEAEKLYVDLLRYDEAKNKLKINYGAFTAILYGKMAPPRRDLPTQGNLENLVANLTTIVQGLVQQNMSNTQNGQNHPTIIDNTSQVVEQFWRYRPPTLTGRADPFVVEVYQKEAKRFVAGLRPELSGVISVFGEVTYA
ncbi:hypothetical protein DH2020_015633 [Rehmannia glutinosa]|uniref:Uncharacterized protein n=1 Tax=Rehmannia glutinosa TaxID=99300 RepID=A0ABR0WUS2_REHGL